MSRLARLSLANRAVVALATFAIAVFGVLGVGQLKQELIPSLQLPVAVVVSVYPGSSPEVVEQGVIEPVEAAVRAVPDIEAITSTASTGLGLTTIELEYGTDLDAVTQRLQTAISRLQTQLPEDVEPTVITGSLDDLPVIQLAAASDAGGESGTSALAATIETVVVPALEDIEGVRTVAVTGGTADQVLVELDAARVAVAGVDPTAVADLLADYGVVLPVGTLTEGDRTYSVQAGARLGSVEDLEALPLGAGTLGDVATVTVTPEAATSYSRLDGSPALGVAITKTPDGNTVDVSHAVQNALADLGPALEAEGVRTAVVFDQAPFIEESIEGLATEGGLGLVFAVVVILVFLASLRSTLVSAVSIPLSLAVTFIVMNATGYSLNILTLGALTISIGRVVDDAIVVIENIKRHLSYGEEKTAAILTAVREVGGAIAASTISTVAVFLPIALVGGMVGELFQPFAVTVAIAMLASLLVALTIVPVLAYWFVRSPRPADGGVDGTDVGAASAREAAEAKERRGLWQRAYVPSLAAALRRPWVTIGVAVVVLVGTLGLVPRLETNFIGDSGQDTVTVTQRFEVGTSLAAQDAAAREVEDALAGVDAIESVQTTVGTGDAATAAFSGGGTSPSASFAITLDGDADGVAAQDDVRAAVEGLVAAPVTAINVAGSEGGFGSSTVDIAVRATDRDDLAAAAESVHEAVRDVEGAAEVANDLAGEQEVLQVTVDREAAAGLGLSETVVSGVVAAAMNPARPIGELDLGDGPLEVVVSSGAAPATRAEIEALVVPSAQGLVPLTDVAAVEAVRVPTSVTRVDGERSATVRVTPATQDVGSLTRELQAAVDGLDLPAGVDVEVGGVASQQQDAFADLGLALLVAIAIVYVVMVATFGSLVQPLILLVSVPFAATGAIVALLVSDTPLGVPALIGALMLVGIVVSNAIVLIDLINQYRERGRSLDDAVREGARKRLRPIVMTALATVFALTPMALGLTGGGAFISKPLALVVIGGLLSSTLLTLLVVPALYVLVERRKERRADRRAARRQGRHAVPAAASDEAAPDATVGARE
ncbi:efflux RND transporter permease subunit [Cellulomonas cellasea]|uniref:Hydrogenase expression protein n=2 Tax=Cellulomonas cellasea TaxID=43670 RepID=A0A0A0B8N3_9CELL|nr:efflux RND transporter permease subunit [Cellulomonas cellasea]KGM03245.1 hydrogenase expression protein [Cellulomonas cellasea DSM 20118]GEA87416.1 hydrogenase expression protein [Cellulomonas cellasea]